MKGADGKVAAKRHWCGACKRFVIGTVKKVGYYAEPKICCTECDAVLGTPEK